LWNLSTTVWNDNLTSAIDPPLFKSYIRPQLLSEITEMTEENRIQTVVSVSCRRLNELLDLQQERGLTQQQIARQANIPAPYLSDIKHDRRPLTELVARRLGQEFNVNYEWLLGQSDRMQRTSERPAASGTLWLPILPHPIEGDPRAQAIWDGTSIELTGIHEAKLAAAQSPYVLRFGRSDRAQRLRQGDLILMSQASEKSAEISVIKSGQNLYLARRAGNQWQRVAEGKGQSALLPSTVPSVGHCLGIIWGALSR
jgi:transcriptional regulator with XRE-family HTH domain